jgi:hypothetical protein
MTNLNDDNDKNNVQQQKPNSQAEESSVTKQLQEIYREALARTSTPPTPTLQSATNRILSTFLAGVGVGLISGLNFGYKQGLMISSRHATLL